MQTGFKWTTTFLNGFVLSNGATILRVHDVKEAVECVELYKKKLKMKYLSLTVFFYVFLCK
jgi:hypothetical protein